MTAHVLIVEDDPVQRRVLKQAVEQNGHVCLLAESGKAGLGLLKTRGTEIGVVIIDMTMRGLDGLSFIQSAHDLGMDIPVIVQTGQGGIDVVVEAMRAGAFDFIVKPVTAERLGTAIAGALKSDEPKGRALRRVRHQPVGLAEIVSASPAMTRVVDLAKRASHSTIPVVLEGEAGVGKEMIARAIHAGSDRATKPFVILNCSAIAPELIERALFGGVAADGEDELARQTGKFVEADGGTLFIDELGDLPLEVQVKLLRAVQSGEVEAAGSAKRRKVNVRLISATAKNLIDEVKEGRFREDLYYRLNVFPITIPALRRRKEDIPFLARAFADRFSIEQKLPQTVGVSAAALALLTAYDWPGNIRQLENAVFRAAVLAQGRELTPGDFVQIAAQVPGFEGETRERDPHAADRPVAGTVPSLVEGKTSQVPVTRETASEEANVADDGIFPGGSLIASTDETGNVRTIAEIEEELIRFALRFYRGQMSQVARKLGIGRSTLYRKLKDYGIDPDDPMHDAA
ncbi:sigma-54-dependent transcriptional regulator [Agrobacterium larrymoorei]|uniref:sigma-54-dependent transcriptional regulator n=1 Tax=Agrobacterium larrymoorei TaxID=160699 RepID=UPI0030C1F982